MSNSRLISLSKKGTKGDLIVTALRRSSPIPLCQRGVHPRSAHASALEIFTRTPHSELRTGFLHCSTWNNFPLPLPAR